MNFERARRLADAVLLEGYVLYPYRASSTKNRFRWAFGVLAPRRWSEAEGSEPFWLESQCVLEARGEGRVEGRLRFIQQQSRRVEARRGDAFVPVESLEVEGRLHLPWDEGVVQEVAFERRLAERAEAQVPWRVEGGCVREEVRDRAGVVRGRVVRERSPLVGALRVASEPCGGGLHRLRLRVENLGEVPAGPARREEMLPSACIATHLLLGAEHAGFVSLLDPPEHARAAVAASKSVHTFPVLAGAPGEDDLVLSAPIILYDHAQLAPESPGDFFDACEIDELLALRTSTLTPAEKREASATDPRAAALLERVERLTPAELERLHGALRDLRAGEMTPRAGPSAPKAPPPGSRVRLRPSRQRRTDAQDLLFEGYTATVEACMTDVDNREYVAVTLDADPAADLHRWYGRFHYYALDEIEPLEPAGAGGPPG